MIRLGLNDPLSPVRRRRKLRARYRHQRRQRRLAVLLLVFVAGSAAGAWLMPTYFPRVAERAQFHLDSWYDLGGQNVSFVSRLKGFARRKLDSLSSSLSVEKDTGSTWSRGNAHENIALLAVQPSAAVPVVTRKRLVYPYSVVPGGVETPEELKLAAERDPEIAAHYADFDFGHARLVRLSAPQDLYLSYRMRGKLYWTKKKIHLPAGEKVITDGKTIARTRCANRGKGAAQLGTSPVEPPKQIFEQPLPQEAEYIPAPFDFDGPFRHPQLSIGRPNQPPINPFPFFPLSVAPPITPTHCETAAQEKLEQSLGVNDNEGKEDHCNPKPPPPVPEPSTLVMISSGLAGLYWRYRRKAA